MRRLPLEKMREIINRWFDPRFEYGDIDWEYLGRAYIIPGEIIRQYKEFVDWKTVNRFQYKYFSKDFVREFRNEFSTLYNTKAIGKYGKKFYREIKGE